MARPRLYMLLDAARDRRIWRGIEETALEVRCLFAGKLHPALAAAAPYLVELRPDANLLRTALEMGWGQAWGSYLISNADIEGLRRHFRRFLRVTTENGKKMFFRYYDPRVLRLYLPTCTEEELSSIFGPVLRFIVEADDPDELLEFSIEDHALASCAFEWKKDPSSFPLADA